jgi:hypothetical protein
MPIDVQSPDSSTHASLAHPGVAHVSSEVLIIERSNHQIFFLPQPPTTILIFVHVPQTILILALFTLAIVIVRIRWDRLSSRLKHFLIFCAVASIAVMTIGALSRINTTSDPFNTIVWWCATLSYIFFVILFTRLRPLWLTSLIASVLILPLLSASAILPLAAFFSNLPHHITPLGNGLVSDLVPIDSITPNAGGADLTIYRRFSRLPFLQLRRQGARYFSTQCKASDAYAVLQADNVHILMVCPALPGHLPVDGRSLIVKLY